jgi:hypothetical protein
MNRLILLLFIGGLTFLLIMLAYNPDVFNDIWLYLIGLSGGIIHLFKMAAEKIKEFSKDLKKESQAPSTLSPKN